MTSTAFYFGCGPLRIPGHGWFAPRGEPRVKYRNAWHPEGCPWGVEADGRLQPETEQRQGVCRMHRRGGWTLIAWWDRSGDHRFGSCSAFALEGDHDFATMVQVFADLFPWASERMTFRLRLEEP